MAGKSCGKKVVAQSLGAKAYSGAWGVGGVCDIQLGAGL